MNIPFGHHELHNRYCFEGTLKLETPLRLSSGRASDLTDAPLMRNRAGIPYIPGASLRGAIRSEVERILAAAGQSVGLSSCTLFTRDDSEDACISTNRKKQEQVNNESDEEAALRFVDAHLCDVCRLFGSTVYASRLVIEDVYPMQEGNLQDKSLIRDGVGIDRDTGTARENVKFDYEVLETGPAFLFRMQVENVTDKDRQMINLVLGLLRQGMYVGGKRSAGLGKITLDTWPVPVKGFENAQDLWQALLAGEKPHKPLTWQGGASC